MSEREITNLLIDLCHELEILYEQESADPKTCEAYVDAVKMIEDRTNQPYRDVRNRTWEEDDKYHADCEKIGGV